jgi:hypothetical protein
VSEQAASAPKSTPHHGALVYPVTRVGRNSSPVLSVRHVGWCTQNCFSEDDRKVCIRPLRRGLVRGLNRYPNWPREKVQTSRLLVYALTDSVRPKSDTGRQGGTSVRRGVRHL